MRIEQWRRWIVAVVVVWCVLVGAGLAAEPPEAAVPPVVVSGPVQASAATAVAVVALPEGIETLRADNLILRSQVVELRRDLALREVELAAIGIERERVALEVSWRASLKVPADWPFDWRTRTFAPKPAPAEAPVPVEPKS